MKESLLRTDKDIKDVYEKYAAMIYKICFLYMKNKADTEDLVQSTFIKMIENREKFEDLNRLKAWLIITASNLCRNSLKSWWRRNVDIDTIPETEDINYCRTDETLNQILALPDKYKTVVYLYYYEGYSCREISEMMKINDSTLRSQLRTGRKLLKLILEAENDE